MITLGEMLRLARKEKRLSQAELAQSLTPPVSITAVHNWEKNKDLPGVGRVADLAAKLDLDPAVLRAFVETRARERISSGTVGDAVKIAGDVKSVVDRQVSVRNRTTSAVGLPVYETSPGFPARGFYMSQQAIYEVARPVKLEGREDVFGLQVQTSDMESAYEKGDFIVVELHRFPKPRDYVLIELRPSEGETLRPMLLRRLLGADHDRIRVEQHNPQRRVSIPAKDVVRIYRVLQMEDLV